MVEPPQERKHEREMAASGSGGRRALPPHQGAFSFFQALFGGGRPAARPVPPRPIYR